METKTKIIAILLLVLMAMNVNAQQNQPYHISEIYLDGVKMEHDDYRPFFRGQMIVDSTFWDDYEEENRRIAVYKSDSLYIHLSSYNPAVLYTKYIEITSLQHEVKFRDMTFRVGMTVDDIERIFPEMKLKETYQKYVGDDNRFFSRPAYFSKQMLVKTFSEEFPFYSCEGLKFQILENTVIAILVDFRTDGDFN
ncbi:MAG: hypothetical protein FWG79_01660 [Bacteroidales bacterium]|nr:hypothetical protein [Bacteroidales bacterium]